MNNLSNGFSQINIKMKSKIILIIGIFILFNNLTFFVLADDSSGGIIQNLASFNSSEISYKLSEDGNSAILTFLKEGILNIKGIKFENISPQDVYGGKSYVKIDNQGKILESHLSTNKNGGEYNINGNIIKVPPTTIFSYDSKNGFKCHNGAEIKKIASTNITGGGIKLWRNGKLYEGIYGTLNFDEKSQAYIDNSDKELGINGLYIANTANKRVNLFFDEKEHEGDYLSFNKTSFILNGPLDISFGPRNPYMKLLGSTALSIKGSSNSKVIIENREVSGLIPKITLLGNSDVIINNGKKDITYDSGDNKWYISNKGSSGYSSPMEIYKSNSNEKIFVDNLNRVVIVPKNYGEYISTDEINGYDIRFSSKVFYNYPTEEAIEKLTGKDILFEEDLPNTAKQNDLIRLQDYWGSLTPETKEAIKNIEFVQKNKESGMFGQLTGYGKGSPAGTANPLTRTIRIAHNYMDYSLFRHEAAHMRDFDLLFTSFHKSWREIEGIPINSYAKTNIFEDVASTVEIIAKDPEKYGVSSYDKPDLIKKLDLLYKNKFISEYEYNAAKEGYNSTDKVLNLK